MAIVDAGGGPATIKVTGSTTPQATASFTPPDGVLLVALCCGGFGTSAAPVITVTDSSDANATNWTKLSISDTATSGKGTAVVAWRYFAVSPGSITVRCAYTNLTGSKYIDVVQLTGVRPGQITGATATATFNTSTSSGASDFSTAITPRTVGSCVLGVTNMSWLSVAPTIGVHDANTTNLDTYNNTTDGTSHASFKYTSNNVASPGASLTLGPTTGGTAKGSGSTAIVEFLPYYGRTIIMQAVGRAANW
ncbi:hypothetical protein ACIRPT_02670 [Streptomyces sp. NPDC101227]|uniref:hypothetical protein n=1 Tax=Streptomyces sp. NPDC101227 TaxID=3366136 RepID=UPI00382FD0BE